MTLTDTTWMTDYYAAWDRADVDAVTAWFDPEIELEDVPTKHVAAGFDAAREFVVASIDKTPGATYDVVSAQQVGDAFAVEWVMQPLGLRGSSFGTLREGKILQNRDYWDSRFRG